MCLTALAAVPVLGQLFFAIVYSGSVYHIQHSIFFCYKDNVLHRPIEVTDGSGHSIYYSSCAPVNNLVGFFSNGIVA